MNLNLVHPWPSVFVGLLLALHVAIGSFVSFTPRFTGSIASSAIAPELGSAYSAPTLMNRRISLYELPSDSNGSSHHSDLVLLENGRALGPAHALHAEIRQRGGGRYSHWGRQVIFSSSDGSDPRTNGRTYTIESSTAVNIYLRLLFSTIFLVVDIGLFFMFQKEILAFLRTRSSVLLGALALLAITAAGLSAFGVFGTVTVANGDLPGDAALSVMALRHAVLGCLISVGMWAAGAGVTRVVLREPHSSLAQILIPAFPVSLILVAVLVAISLVAPQGRRVAIVVWVACLLPLLGWRPPWQGLAATIKTSLIVIPLAIAFGAWLGLLWHGPTQTLPGSPSGDLTFYAGKIWSLTDHAYPFVDLGYENGAVRGYFNMLFPALGATLLYLPGFDPLLFLLASGGASYILLSALMLHFYLADRAPQSTSVFSVIILVLSFVVAARYPYWVVESIPVVFVPALAIAVWWMAERGQRAVGWTVAAMVAGLAGSILSKVGTAAVLVPLGAAGLWRQFGLFPFTVRAVALAVGCVFGVYCVAMLWHFLPLFIAVSNVGPESFRNPVWWFAFRDVAAVALALLAWLIADIPVALALTIGLLAFLLYSWLFQINFVCVAILLGLMTFVGRERSALARLIAFVAFALALPAAMLSDPAGVSSGIVWIVCLGGAVLMAVLSAVPIKGADSPLTFRISAAIGLATLVVTAFGLVGVARDNIIVDSGWDSSGPQLTPELRDVWSAVRRLTPHDALIFTDQVDETINVLGGWNTYAFRGQRQIYLSSYYTDLELRSDNAKLRKLLAINESVLNGTKNPGEIPTRSHYDSVFAVISASRAVPTGWTKTYGNKDYAIFKISP